MFNSLTVIQFLLPQIPFDPPQKRKQQSVPGQARAISITLKTLRDPPLHFQLSRDPSTTVAEIKDEISSQASLVSSKVKLLYNKKPVGDAIKVSDMLDEGKNEVTMTVMLMPGAIQPKVPTLESQSSVAPADLILRTDNFWDDLRGFLTLRLKDEDVANRTTDVFRRSIESKS